MQLPIFHWAHLTQDRVFGIEGMTGSKLEVVETNGKEMWVIWRHTDHQDSCVHAL